MEDMPTVYSAFLEHPLSVRLSVHHLHLTSAILLKAGTASAHRKAHECLPAAVVPQVLPALGNAPGRETHALQPPSVCANVEDLMTCQRHRPHPVLSLLLGGNLSCSHSMQ